MNSGVLSEGVEDKIEPLAVRLLTPLNSYRRKEVNKMSLLNHKCLPTLSGKYEAKVKEYGHLIFMEHVNIVLLKI